MDGMDAAEEKAFLNKGIRITIHDEREEPEKSHEFYYRGGIAEFVKHLNKSRNVLHDKPIYFERVSDVLAIEVAIQYNDGYDERSIHSPTTSTRLMEELTFQVFDLLLQEPLMPTRNRPAWPRTSKDRSAATTYVKASLP